MKLPGLLSLLVSLTCLVPALHAQLTYNELLVQYDSAWTFRNLQVIPIKFKTAAPGTYIPAFVYPPLTLTEALEKHKIKLQEMQYNEGADVNWLQVTNHSKQSVLVQSGEIVEGGKQDRMAGETKFIAPGTTDYIHVYCVEKRRWDDKPKDFKPKGMANSEVRKAMDVSSRQSEVWKEIDRQYARQKKTSESWSYLQLYTDSVLADTSYLRYFTQKYRDGDSAFAGFVFITGDRILSTELFASDHLLQISFNNLFGSYIQSAIVGGTTPAVSHDQVKLFMDKVLLTEEIQKAYVTAHGKIHKSDGKIIHLIAYPDQ